MIYRYLKSIYVKPNLLNIPDKMLLSIIDTDIFNQKILLYRPILNHCFAMKQIIAEYYYARPARYDDVSINLGFLRNVVVRPGMDYVDIGTK